MKKFFFISLFSVILINTLSDILFETNKFNSKWEYKVLEFYGDSLNRKDEQAFNFKSINVSEYDLNNLGSDGWELVTSHLEMETAFPNFGNNSYVTGLQPNVRPQKVTLVFKRVIKPKYYMWFLD